MSVCTMSSKVMILWSRDGSVILDYLTLLNLTDLPLSCLAVTQLPCGTLGWELWTASRVATSVSGA